MTGDAGVPRLLAIMGSGETAPTMVKVHRGLLERVGEPVNAVMLDTPFGFQENRQEVAARATTYFSASLQTEIEVASLGDPDDPLGAERFVTLLRRSRYVFAGPGSPTYALRKWTGTVVPTLLGEKLAHGGCVVFASAAALTLGLVTVPVYEIYKCGQDPAWLDGLDLLSEAGIEAAVIPHYDNTEGGTHDTRFCYLGERRLSRMERELPLGAFVLGIDEHTAVVVDLEARTATVTGRGVLTVRAAGASATFADGSTVDLDVLVETADRLRAGDAGEPDPQATQAAREVQVGNELARATSPLVDLVRDREAAFAGAMASRDVPGAVTTLLELEREITVWSTDIPAGDELDRAHASLRSLMVELAALSEVGARDPRQIVGPFVEELLSLRLAARLDRRYDQADAIRDRLVELGVEVRDAPEGTEWELREPS